VKSFELLAQDRGLEKLNKPQRFSKPLRFIFIEKSL